jgi:hypothetical protein
MRILAAFSISVLAACTPDSKLNSNLRSPKPRLSSSAQQPIGESKTVDGNIGDQKVSAIFPAGSIGIGMKISIEEGQDIATPATAYELKIDGFGSSGPAVIVTSSEAVDPYAPFMISLPIPQLGLAVVNLSSLVVVYKVKVESEDKIVSGIVPASQLEVSDGKIQYTSPYFGAFQVSTVSSPIEKTEVASLFEYQAKAGEDNLEPLKLLSRSPVIAKAGDVIRVKGENFRPTVQVSFEGRSLMRVNLKSGSELEFEVPSVTGLGLIDVAFAQDATTAMMSIGYNGTNDYPLIGLPPEQVCNGQKYYGIDGALMEGFKQCTVTLPPNCGPGVQTACIATNAYVAVDISALNPGIIKKGVTLFGVLGKFPSSEYRLDEAVMVDDLTSTNMLAKLSSGTQFEFFDSTGTSYYATGDTNLASPNIANSVSVLGVSGSATLEGHSNCSSDAQTGCVATPSFKAVDMNLLKPAFVKTGYSVGSVTGQYPSLSFPLEGASNVKDLTQVTFHSDVASADQFEFFDSKGNRQVSQGDADLIASNIKEHVIVFGVLGSLSNSGPAVTPDPWDIRAGVVVGSVTGRLKTNCRNSVNTALFNFDGSLASLGNTGVLTGTQPDWWDTMSDQDNSGAFLPQNFPTGWSNNNYCDDQNWELVSCPSTAECLVKDKLSGLTVTHKAGTAKTWANAVRLCDAATFNGQLDWRVPTLKEALTMFSNGLYDAYDASDSVGWPNLAMDADDAWTATNSTTNTSNAYSTDLRSGVTKLMAKTTALAVYCVRP